jgi:hypothetical protein
VVYPHQIPTAWWIENPPPWPCASCSDPVWPPCCFWQGATQLFLHADCAAHLGPNLIADAREAMLGGDPGPHWRKRLVDAVRHRLVAEEIAA